jgi:hypothetical protein
MGYIGRHYFQKKKKFIWSPEEITPVSVALGNEILFYPFPLEKY